MAYWRSMPPSKERCHAILAREYRRMEPDGTPAVAPPERAAGARPGLVELGGAGAADLWAEPGDVFPGASVGAIGAHAAPTLARVDLGAVGQSRRPTPRRGGGQLLWAAVGLGVARLAGSGATAGPGVG